MKSDARSPHADPEHTDEVDRTASPKRLLIITALAVFVGEVLVMLILSALPPPMPTLVMALAGGAVTAVLATPFLYLFLFRPMQQHIQVRRRAEEELDNLNRHLKALVAERTESLAQTNRRLTHEAEELRRTVDSLRRNDEFFQEAVERAPCLILTFDAESQRCSYVNSRVTDLLGYGQNELAVNEEMLVNRLVEARDRASFREVVKELVNGPEGQAVSGSCGFIASSGRVVQLRFATTVLSRTPTMEAKDILLTAMPATV